MRRGGEGRRAIAGAGVREERAFASASNADASAPSGVRDVSPSATRSVAHSAPRPAPGASASSNRRAASSTSSARSASSATQPNAAHRAAASRSDASASPPDEARIPERTTPSAERRDRRPGVCGSSWSERALMR